MATSRRKVSSLTNLSAKQTLQKLDGSDVILEASGSLASGKVTINVPVQLSSSNGEGVIKNNSGTTAITLDNNGNTKVNNALILGWDRIRRSGGGDFLLSTNNDVKINSSGGNIELTGTVLTSGSLNVAGNGSFTAKDATFNGQVDAYAGLVVHNSALLVDGGGISGSSTIQAGGALTVGGNATVRGDLDVLGNMTVRGTPTIINSDVLEVKDNIIVINKVSGSDSAYVEAQAGLYVNRGNAETSSLLWVSSSNDWQFQKTIAGSPSSADLVVNKLKPLLISGSSGVSVNSSLTIAATASLHTSGSFTNISIPTSSVTVEGTTYKVFNLDTAFHAIDSAMSNAGISAASIQNAYKRLRYQASGTLDGSGEAVIALPTSSLGGDAFPTADFNYIKVDVMVKESNRWINDLVAVDMEVSGSPSQVYITISAAGAAPSTEYRLVAVNENTANFLIV